MRPDPEEQTAGEENADEEAGPDDGKERRRSLGVALAETVAGAKGYALAEVALLQAETSHNFAQLRGSLLKAGGGALLLMAALVLLTVALVIWLGRLVGLELALLLLAAAYLLAGGALVRNGLASLSLAALLPRRSLARLSRRMAHRSTPEEAAATGGEEDGAGHG